MRGHRGTTVRLRMAHMRLCRSRMCFVQAYPRKTREMGFGAHNRAFELFGGSCQRDNHYDVPGTSS